MKNTRLIQLDILRGVAILLVLGRHPMISPDASGRFRGMAEFWFRFGWTGVDLFFVLSGFLVGGLLFSEIRSRNSIDVSRFLIRRGFKIWPSYYLFLALFFALRVLKDSPAAGLKTNLWEILPNVVNLQNYLGSLRMHTWSLAVEEHFYLLLPLALWLMIRSAVRSGEAITSLPGVPALSLALIVICTALRWNVARGVNYSHHETTFPTHLRIDSLFFGVLIAYVFHFHEAIVTRLAERRGVLIGLGLALLSPVMVTAKENSAFVGSVGYALLYLGYGCLLVAIVTTPVDDSLAGRLMRSVPARGLAFVGVYSFTIYLWHIDVGIRMGRIFARWEPAGPWGESLRWGAGMAVYVILSAVVGIILSKVVERPALAVRDRLFPTRAGSVPESRPHPPSRGREAVGSPLTTG